MPTTQRRSPPSTIQLPLTEIDSRQAILSDDEDVLIDAAKINGAWNKQVSGILEAGQLLLASKKKRSGKPRIWLKLVGNLTFSESVSQRLMKIARNKILSNPAHGPDLPPSWRTLYVLSQATDKQLEKWLADRTINPEMERKDADKLVNPKPAKAKKEKDIDASNSDNAATTVSNTAPSNEAQQSVQHTYTVACDASADWSNVDWDMVDDLIEELQSRKAAEADKRRQDKEWQAAEAAKPITPLIAE
jgi:hypothetical protein